MSFALGTATGRIELDYDGSGVNKAKNDIEGLQKKTADTSGWNKLGNAAGVGGLAIAAGFGVAINGAADFEARMSAIQAVSGATGKEFDGLRDKALQLGKDTSFSAGEAALAIEELSKAGLSVPAIMGGAADATVALAAAGEIALPEAATIASNAMNQFGLKAKDMVDVADMFAGAANTSAIGVGDIGQALQQVGAVANLAGVSLEDTTAAIGLMGNAGIAGSDAGTSLKSMFMRLNPTTKKAAEEMKALGIITADGSNRFYDAQGNMRSLSDVSGVLQESLKGMSKQQQQAALTTLFGSDAIRGAAILAKNGSKGFDKFATSMGKVSAADVAAKRLDNLKGDMEAMKGSMETLGIVVGTALLPPLRRLVDMVTEALNAFLNLDDGTQKFIIAAIAALGGVLLLVAGIAKMVVFVGAVQAAFVAMQGTMLATFAATLGPVLLVVAAIAAVIVIVVLLWKYSETFRDVVLGVWAEIQTAIAAFVSFFKGEVWPQLQSVFDLVMQAWTDLTTGTGGALEQIRTIISTALTLITSIMQIGWNLIKGVVMGVWVAIKGVIMGAINVIKGIINVVMGIIKGDWSQAWTGIKQILSGVWTAIKAIIKGSIMVVKAILVAAWNAIKAITVAVWNGIKAALQGIWNVIKSLVSSAISGIKSGLGAAWDWVLNKTRDIWDNVANAVSNGVERVMDFIRDLPDMIRGFFSDAGTYLYDAGRDIVQGLMDGIASMANALKDKAKDLLGGLGKLLPGSPVKEGPLRVLNQGYAGKQIMRMLMDGIASETWGLQRQMADVAGMIPAGMPAVTGDGGRVVRPRGGGGGRSRFIEGKLKIIDGDAWVTGIAVDLDDDDDDYEDTINRMGPR